MKITGLMTIATISMTVAVGSGAAFADTTNVSRCNYTDGGGYLPGLWITRDGATRLIKVGEEGLTRRILFDNTMAMDFARTQIGGDAGAGQISMTNSCSSASYSYAAEDDVIVAAVLPASCGPVDCGPPDCGPPDCGPPDCGPPDCGPPDCGPPDCGPPDCGPPDYWPEDW